MELNECLEIMGSGKEIEKHETVKMMISIGKNIDLSRKMEIIKEIKPHLSSKSIIIRAKATKLCDLLQ